MLKKKTGSVAVGTSFSWSAFHAEVFQKIEYFNETLPNLRYASKSTHAKFMYESGELIKFFNEKLLPQIRLEEAVIYPFLEKHVPKLEPIIRFLKAEHAEFKVNLEVFEFLFKDFRMEKNSLNQQKIFERLNEKGIYMIYLIRNHLQEENQSIYKTIEEDLLVEEEKELLTMVQRFRAVGRD